MKAPSIAPEQICKCSYADDEDEDEDALMLHNLYTHASAASLH